MHVAWLGKKSPFCGNVTYSRTTTEALLDRGYQVSFLHFDRAADPAELRHAPPGAIVPPRDLDWPHCHEVALPFLHKSQVYTIPAPSSHHLLARAVGKLHPDLVHASLTLSPLDLRLPELCNRLGIPLVATFHPPFDSQLRNLRASAQLLTYVLYAPFLARYDRAIVFSRAQRDFLGRLGVPADKLAIIPNGVDAERYCPGPSAFKQQIRARRLFVYQGRISSEKNVGALLRAWTAADLGDDCKLAIVGDGPLLPTLRERGDRGVVWLGFVADETRRIEILRAADAFILPSLVEGLSLSLLEAMACGVACLATDAGADGEALEAGAGIVLDTQDVTAQLRSLLPLCRDRPELTETLGRAARERVLERYTLRHTVAMLEALYAEVKAAKACCPVRSCNKRSPGDLVR